MPSVKVSFPPPRWDVQLAALDRFLTSIVSSYSLPGFLLSNGCLHPCLTALLINVFVASILLPSCWQKNRAFCSLSLSLPCCACPSVFIRARTHSSPYSPAIVILHVVVLLARFGSALACLIDSSMIQIPGCSVDDSCPHLFSRCVCLLFSF
ncbi:hypothetical protein BO79DRAFT_24196 [Aspergillus costaricaensis CBS 115574]|uniref:Uncharacterized protein n=1 Tax=Aspergillus costaricaensis CBS 115574 TaxID=1448317 RepID=A0ACD1IT08_9EURO|nr:hypothetical protein BO79DRAFT_24196 [Aspergillus costaricaensis CBS 115574]RAK93470.1 hypothetical protein BO79DRAFT_24196 [Aspergillus costaricaensis CBS 115574]